MGCIDCEVPAAVTGGTERRGEERRGEKEKAQEEFGGVLTMRNRPWQKKQKTFTNHGGGG